MRFANPLHANLAAIHASVAAAVRTPEPFTHDGLRAAFAELWPLAAAEHGVAAGGRSGFLPVLDGYDAIGFSVRLFGPPPEWPCSGEPSSLEKEQAAAGYRALETLLKTLEARGYEVARDGNAIQPGVRLVVGWHAPDDAAKLGG